MRPQDAEHGASRDKAHGGSAGLLIEITGQGGAAGVRGWAGSRDTSSARVERVGSDGRL